jgi:hypothetical protein
VLRIFINFSEKWTGRHFGQFLLILTKKLLGSILGHFINFDKNGLGDTLGVIINFAKKWIGRHFGRLFFPKLIRSHCAAVLIFRLPRPLNSSRQKEMMNSVSIF